MDESIIKRWGMYKYPSESIIRITKKLFNKKSKILDFGCGGGRHFLFLKDNFDAYACDKYQELVSYVKSKTNDTSKIFLYKNTLPFENNFLDGILVCGVFEYMDNNGIENFFYESKRCLKDNGYIIITLTNDSTKPSVTHEYQDFSIDKVNELLSPYLKNIKIGYEDFEYNEFKLKRFILTGNIN